MSNLPGWFTQWPSMWIDAGACHCPAWQILQFEIPPQLNSRDMNDRIPSGGATPGQARANALVKNPLPWSLPCQNFLSSDKNSNAIIWLLIKYAIRRFEWIINVWMIERKQRSQHSKVINLLHSLVSLHNMMKPSIWAAQTIAVIACTIPATCVQSERSFSCLKL